MEGNIVVSKNDPNSLFWAWEEDDNVYCAYEMMEYITIGSVVKDLSKSLFSYTFL